MGKTAVIVLLLLTLTLLGVQGCSIPNLQGIKSSISGEQQVVQLRGLSVEFEKGKPRLSSVEGERLPVIRSGDDFNIGLKVNNYALKPVSGTIGISNLAKYVTNIKEEQSFTADEAVLQDNVIYPGVSNVEFGPYIYEESKVGGGVEDSLITEISLDYSGLITADLCFNKEEENIGITCNNNEILTENVLKGDAGTLPVSIERIEKEVVVKQDGASFYLTVKLRNFGDGSIEENKLTGFNVNIFGGSIECNRDIIFRDNKAEIDCKGDMSFGEESFAKTPIEFEFSYIYRVIKTINYKAI